MRDGTQKKSKLSWSKTLVKKWFNIQSKTEDFHADHNTIYGGGDEDWRNNFSEREACTIKKSKTESLSKRNSDWVRRGKIDRDATQVTDVHNYRIFVATWSCLKISTKLFKFRRLAVCLTSWHLCSWFQEIVPLNAGNVLGTEDSGPT